MRRWRRANPEHCSAVNRRRNLARRREALEQASGGVCVRCGFSDIRALQFDHIDGGGSKARNGRPFDTRFGSYIQYLKYASTHPDEFQVLCANCNWIKRWEKGEGTWRGSSTTTAVG